MLKMKAKLSQEIYGGEWSHNENCVIYRNEEKPQLLHKIKQEVHTTLKDKNYFKVSVKKNRIKVSWFLAPQIRLIRTISRVKYLSEGKIGNFSMISVNQNFEDLKDQIKLFV